ncbi:MAG: hypothetical protein QOE90_317 [Thermoplasmata archaeon]|jgi:predicted RNA binding protein YcfA (HicA-like mRNA interferase family)|nr:hypothetical protein [Thermoplasmata archaeon]
MATRRVVSARELLRVLRSLGFEVVGRKGSHIRLKRRDPSPTRVVVMPDHAEIAPGTLASILRQAGLTREDLDERLR